MDTPSVTTLKRLIHALLTISKQDMEKRLERLGVALTPLQYWVLAKAAQPGATVNGIAKGFGLRPPSLTPVVNALEADGYLERRADRLDRRKHRLIILPAGRRALRTVAHDPQPDRLDDAFACLGTRKQKSLLLLLKHLADAATRYEKE